MIAKSSFMRQPRTGQRRFCILMQFSLHPKRTFSPFLAQLTRAPSSHQAVGYDAVSRNASPPMQAGLNFQTQLILHFLKKTVSMGKISLETFWTFFWRKSWNLPQKLFFKAWSFQNLGVLSLRFTRQCLFSHATNCFCLHSRISWHCCSMRSFWNYNWWNRTGLAN